MKTIDSVQKIIKVGDSLAITIPAKDARALNFKAGDNVRSVIEEIDTTSEVGIADDYKKFAEQYHSALKNLLDR